MWCLVTLLRLISAEGEGRECDVSVTLLPLIPAEGEGRLCVSL